jgi:hypothetical protein
MKRAISAVAATAVCALGVAASASAATDVQQAQSGNWSGYVAGAGGSTTFKSVSASWVVPTAKCPSATGSTYSAFWVGLGGAGSADALEQAGIEANCAASGAASYYAWYELVPKAPVRVDLPVSAGDHVSTTVDVDGTSVSISLRNETTGQSFSRTLTMSDPDTSSAEWIAEAPSQCEGGSTSDCTPLPLTDFGSVQFNSASATDSSGHTGSISDSTWNTAAVTLSPYESSLGFGGAGYSSSGGSSGGATPSSLSTAGSGFSVAYAADAGESQSGSAGYGSGGDGYSYGSGGDGYSYGSGGYGSDESADGGGYGSDGYGVPGSGSDGGWYLVVPSAGTDGASGSWSTGSWSTGS